jgi:selenide,water dikinase
MGGTPLFALAIVGMPVNTLPLETIGKILQGGEAVCRAAGIPIAGGHTIDSVEPIYGLVAIGIVNPAHLKRNSGAKPGDKLILGKPLGVGVHSAALKKDQLLASDYEAMVETTTQLNTPGPVLACLDGVHAVTDVTGFGLAGHLLEVCKGSGLRATVNYADLPLLARAGEFVEAGLMTGASGRNWASYGDRVSLAAGLDSSAQTLLSDPQTSGACSSPVRRIRSLKCCRSSCSTGSRTFRSSARWPRANPASRSSDPPFRRLSNNSPASAMRVLQASCF